MLRWIRQFLAGAMHPVAVRLERTHVKIPERW